MEVGSIMIIFTPARANGGSLICILYVTIILSRLWSIYSCYSDLDVCKLDRSSRQKLF